MTSDKQKSLTAERLRELLAYDPDTGLFTWRVRTNGRVNVGAVAGTKRKDGYFQIQIGGYIHLAHRLAWLYVTGAWPDAYIDHLNCDKSDTRFSNLRESTHGGNMQNRRTPLSTNKTGFLGVSMRRGGFKAQIGVNGKHKNIGDFKTPEEAHAAYVKAKRQLHPYGTL